MQKNITIAKEHDKILLLSGFKYKHIFMCTNNTKSFLPSGVSLYYLIEHSTWRQFFFFSEKKEKINWKRVCRVWRKIFECTAGSARELSVSFIRSSWPFRCIYVWLTQWYIKRSCKRTQSYLFFHIILLHYFQTIISLSSFCCHRCEHDTTALYTYAPLLFSKTQLFSSSFHPIEYLQVFALKKLPQ